MFELTPISTIPLHLGDADCPYLWNSSMGVLLAIVAVIVSYVEEFIWIIAAIALIFIVITFYVVKFKAKASVSSEID